MKYDNTAIRFNTNKKYRHLLDQEFKLDLCQTFAQDSDFNGFVTLTKAGTLTLSKGYAWDGVSFPILDVDSCKNLRASAIHDALYQLMRNEALFNRKGFKKDADRIFRKICIQDGVSKPIAWIYWIAVRIGGKPGTEPGSKFPNGQSPCKDHS